MTKQEFEKLAFPVSQEEYEKIEFVYTWHPGISETGGKEQIAGLYKTFGMRIISDMHPTARQHQELETLVTQKRMELDNLLFKLNALRKG